MMHVAVAIVGYRNVRDIVNCISALVDSDHKAFELVICENGGPEAFAALQAAIPKTLLGGQRVQIIQAPSNGGFASGVNICIAQSSYADAWWILNPDTEPSPPSMAALVAELESGRDAAGGPLYFPSGKLQSCGGIWRPWLARTVSIGTGKMIDEIPSKTSVESKQSFISGASMIISRRFLEITGPMPEGFFLYCEEIDWCLRAVSLGMRLGFAPNARVLHHQGTTTGCSTDLKSRSRLSVYLDERNKMILTRNHFMWRLPVAGLASLVLIALRYLRKGAVKQFYYGISGWFAGMKGEQGIPPWVR